MTRGPEGGWGLPTRASPGLGEREPLPAATTDRLAGAVPAARHPPAPTARPSHFRVCIVSHILIIHEKASQSIPSMIPLR